MDHAARVGVGHRLAHLLEDREIPRPVLRRVRPAFEQGGQGAAPDQLHGDVEPGVGKPAQLVDRDDARVLELAGDLGLLDEATDHLGAVAVLLQDDLDGHVAADIDVAALEHDAHAAAGDLAEKLVAPGVSRRRGHVLGTRQCGPRPILRAVVEQQAGDRPDRLVEAREYARGSGRLPIDGASFAELGRHLARPRKHAGRVSVRQQAARAEPSGGVRESGGPATGTGVCRIHRGTLQPAGSVLGVPACNATPPSGMKRTIVERYRLR